MEAEQILEYRQLCNEINNYRNSEKRKEKSRDAARSRRGKEAEIFSELASQLPMSASTIDSLDKASVMRLLLSSLKVNSIMEKRPKLEIPGEDTMEALVDPLYPKALEGFLIVLSKEGDFIYTSETVSKFLGLTQIDLMGQSIYEFAHPCDHEEVQELLSPHEKGDERMAAKTIFIRLKCTLTSKGRSVNLKSAVYKVFKLTGKYVPDDAIETEDVDVIVKKEEEEDGYDSDCSDKIRAPKPHYLPHFVAIGEAIHHPSNIEVPLDRRTFISRHSMNMRFTDCDERIKRLIGYHSEEMIGQSFYGFHHAIDSKMMEKAFKDLFSKGQTATGQYRFLAKDGGYVWMVTEATVIFNNRSQKPECVVCVHYVLSHVEQHGRILSEIQLPSTTVKEECNSPASCEGLKVRTSPPPPKVSRPSRACKRRDVKLEEIFHVPTFSTESVLGEKTEDMEQDFYFPPGVKKTRDHGDQLNLSHLSPRDGDVCIPLSVPLFEEVKTVEGFHTPLNLFDGLPMTKTDPPLVRFEGGSGDPRMISPNGSTPDSTMSPVHSPPSYLTTINPSDISAMDTLFTNLDPSVENGQEIDFTSRAPFIPMTSDHDFVLSQQTADSLLSMGADLNPGIYGCTESVFNVRDEMYDGPEEKKSKTPLEMMGDHTIKKSLEMPHDQMMMKMKRRLDRSNLEKGPPAKMMKYQIPAVIGSSLHVRASRDNSVLMNLLLKGEDVANGYSVTKKNNINISGKRVETSGFLQNLLTSVSRHDVEVNAPVNSSCLLQGQDIMHALSMNRK